MPQNLTEKLIASHVLSDEAATGTEIALRVDQTLMPDSGGPAVCAALEAMAVERVAVPLAVQYVDHNLLQIGPDNASDHTYLRKVCAKLGIWFSRPGNGVSHCVHMARFGVPGALLAGADSHTPSAGGLGMLAIGVGGLDLATVLAGSPLYLDRPRVFGVRVEGALPAWVSAKDVVLELLRRHGVDDLAGQVIEYSGPGLACLSAMDRHVIANMGTELGALSSVFPSDARTRHFLALQGRADVWVPLAADEGATYDAGSEVLDLSRLEPLIALPGSPAHVVPVREVTGRPVAQVVIGSSANSGLRDYMVPAALVAGRAAASGVSFDVNPSSRQAVLNMTKLGGAGALLQAGARIHQSGCLGCVGIGQTMEPGQISLRTMPRNFPGRSGTPEDAVYLCSPETAAAAALTGVITDPRDLEEDLGIRYPAYAPPSVEEYVVSTDFLVPPSAEGAHGARSRADRAPIFDPIPASVTCEVILRVGDDVSTDEILPGGERTLSLRSNLPAISRYLFSRTDPTYVERAEALAGVDGHVIIGGRNYGQGSSREQAAAGARLMGLRFALALSYSRTHRKNLVNYGVLPLRVADPAVLGAIPVGARIRIDGVRTALAAGEQRLTARIEGGDSFEVLADLSPRERRSVLGGGLLNTALGRGASGAARTVLRPARPEA
ncbi:aconitate hydratase [Streptomyces sp. NPDC050560]|uniref:aconitate hydratase n=1 Tax=Streptomyces sp. NPDC050560 TaxID=3365630 RepID=UPI0037B9AAB6